MKVRFGLLILTCAFAAQAFAAEDFSKLALFKSGGLQKGLWQLQLLESSEPSLQQTLAAVGNVGFCADIAAQMAKNATQEAEQNCTSKILADTATSAEVELTCGDDNRSHIKLQKENAQSYLSDITRTSASATQHYKMRYTYKGECKGDALIQMDKNSPACKALGNVDMTAMCANAPEQYRAQCEQQAKQTRGMCQ